MAEQREVATDQDPIWSSIPLPLRVLTLACASTGAIGSRATLAAGDSFTYGEHHGLVVNTLRLTHGIAGFNCSSLAVLFASFAAKDDQPKDETDGDDRDYYAYKRVTHNHSSPPCA